MTIEPKVYSTEELIARLRRFGHGQDLFMLAASALEYSIARADALQEDKERTAEGYGFEPDYYEGGS